jgi:hypothetical protein
MVNMNDAKVWLGGLLMKLVCCFCGREISKTKMDPLAIDIRSDGTDEKYREGLLIVMLFVSRSGYTIKMYHSCGLVNKYS